MIFFFDSYVSVPRMPYWSLLCLQWLPSVESPPPSGALSQGLSGLLTPLLPCSKWVEVHSDLSRTQCPGHHGLEQLLPPCASASPFPSAQPLLSLDSLTSAFRGWGFLLLALGTSSSSKRSPRGAAQLPSVSASRKRATLGSLDCPKTSNTTQLFIKKRHMDFSLFHAIP